MTDDKQHVSRDDVSRWLEQLRAVSNETSDRVYSWPADFVDDDNMRAAFRAFENVRDAIANLELARQGMYTFPGDQMPDDFPPDEWKHLVEVGSVKPLTGKVIDVHTPNDPTYFHVLLSPGDYLTLLRRGEIERHSETGYPSYIGSERLRS